MYSIKHSRETAVHGLSIQNLKSDFCVFIYGFNGLAVEICRNLILLGIKCVSIFDKPPHKLLSARDLSSNCFARTEYIGVKTRLEASLASLQALNDETKVQVINEFNEDYDFGDMIIVCEEYDYKTIRNLNKMARKHKTKRVGFLFGVSLGLFNSVFVDFGKNFQQNFSKKKKTGIINKYADSKFWFEGDNLNDDEQISLKNMQKCVHPMNFRIKSVSINDESKFFEVKNYSEETKEVDLDKFLQNGGIYEEFPSSQICDFLSFKDFFKNYQKDLVSRLDETSDFPDNKDLFWALMSLFKFHHEFSRLPEACNEEDTNNMKTIFTKLNPESSEKSMKFIEDFSKFAEVNFAPLEQAFAAIITEECFKFLGVNLPIKQLLFHQVYDFLEESPFDFSEITNKNSRYCDIMTILGASFMETLKNER